MRSILKTARQSTWKAWGLKKRRPHVSFLLVTLLLCSGQTQHPTAGQERHVEPERQNSSWLSHKQSQQTGSSAGQSSPVPRNSERKEMLQFYENFTSRSWRNDITILPVLYLLFP